VSLTPTAYLEQSSVTDPGPWRSALALEPADAALLRGFVPGLVIHADMGGLYGADLSMRTDEARLRTVAGMLERLLELDPRPLTAPRDPGTRLVGNCRQSSVLYCAMLRAARIPARVRAGFSAYFTSPIRGDHWVAERWDGSAGRWLLADPELDGLLMADNGIEFDPDDLPRDRFVLAGQAWLRCRAGDEDAGRYGLNPQVTGLAYVRAQLLRDLAALNRVEVGPWDAWGNGVDPELLDAVARATTDDAAAAAATLYGDHPELQPPSGFTLDPAAAGPMRGAGRRA
jgi:Transglutaminase-like superfamily